MTPRCRLLSTTTTCDVYAETATGTSASQHLVPLCSTAQGTLVFQPAGTAVIELDNFFSGLQFRLSQEQNASLFNSLKRPHYSDACPSSPFSPLCGQNEAESPSSHSLSLASPALLLWPVSQPHHWHVSVPLPDLSGSPLLLWGHTVVIKKIWQFLQLVLLHIKLTDFGLLIFFQSKCIYLFVKSGEGFYKVLQVSFSLTLSVWRVRSCAFRLSRLKSISLSFFLCCNRSSFSSFLSLINLSGLEARPLADTSQLLSMCLILGFHDSQPFVGFFTWSQWVPSCPSHFESSTFYFFFPLLTSLWYSRHCISVWLLYPWNLMPSIV